MAPHEHTCPRCGLPYVGHPALSRQVAADVCPACGMDEAIREFAGKGPLPLSRWADPPKGVSR